MAWLGPFTAAAGRYWLSVFPVAAGEIRDWERRAHAIADPALRQTALNALRAERRNLEGAAAFAAFLPVRCRHAVVRACVAFQAAYDYVDALSEQPSAHPSRNARHLHEVLLSALGRRGPGDYYRHHGTRCDGGYLSDLRDTCWTVLRACPSYALVASAAQEAARRIQTYQALNLSESHGGRGALAKWSSRIEHDVEDLRWWEIAASTGSSLLVFALIAAASRDGVSAEHVDMLSHTYFPWAGALHTLLDSLVDQGEDRRTGHRSLLDYYGSPQTAAARIGAIASHAMRYASCLQDGDAHRTVIAAMASFYLSAAPADSPYTQLVRAAVLAAMGDLARPTMLIMGARRKAAQLRLSRRRQETLQASLWDAYCRGA